MGITSIKWEDFKRLVVDIHNKFPELRKGQVIMVALKEDNMKLYNELLDTKYDCFYSDSLVTNSLRHIHKEMISNDNNFKWVK